MAKEIKEFETERLFLRGINADDTEEIVAWRGQPDVYRFFKNPHQISLEEHMAWFQNSYLNNENRYDWICIEKATGIKIGVFGLLQEDMVVEINYILSPQAQHKGYAYEGMKTLVQYAIEKWNGTTIIAEIHKENTASIRLAERLGFKLSLKHNDFLRYQL